MKNTERIFKDYQESIYQFDKQGQVDYLRALIAHLYGQLEENKKFITAFQRAKTYAPHTVSDRHKIAQ